MEGVALIVTGKVTFAIGSALVVVLQKYSPALPALFAGAVPGGKDF